MIPYPDAGFLLTLLIETDRSSAARSGLLLCDPPFLIHPLHQLQVETFILQLEKAANFARRRAGLTAARLWKWYFIEGLFDFADADWPAAFRLALSWNSVSKSVPPPPLLALHPAIALVMETTHFLSFEPRSRSVASKAGLQLLPEVL